MIKEQKFKENESMALSLLKQVVGKAISGNDTLNISGAGNLAKTYKNDYSYKSNDERVDSLINWESGKNFTAGFITGVGGLVTLPITLPSSLISSWVIQSRLCAAVASLYGHDLDDERVQLMVILTILGDTGKEILKEAGIEVGKQMTISLLKNLAPKLIKELNKQVGFKLITKTTQKSLLGTLGRAVPLIGGFISGSIDAASCKMVGTAAKAVFKN